ncbi:MAG: chemotaxis protein CheB [Gammaproteobacteria bacterium]|nr:chemotaxis protein CheB [Gammaproteobacteria bacterium]
MSDLARVLIKHDLIVVGRYPVDIVTLEQVNAVRADVILVDLDESADQVLDILQNLLENAQLPIVFNDSATTELSLNVANPEWGRRLTVKLWSITRRRRPPPKAVAAPAIKVPAKPVAPQTKATPSKLPREVSAEDAMAANGPLHNLWVLGASLGGPLAVREFLSKLPGDLPIAFVLVQHIGASHLDLLAEQLDRVTPLRVFVAKAGHALKRQEVVLAPVDERILVDTFGRVVLVEKTERSIYSPCIDFVMQDMAQRYGKYCGAIIFSGMGNDGEQGCHAIAAAGGEIWAQDAESCVISSMPDNARKTGHVSFNGTPEELANALVKRFKDKLPNTVGNQ